MNPQKVASMQVEGGRRCSESDLKLILLNTPFIIVRSRGSKLRANVGLGNIVYIRPVRGHIKDVKLGADVYADETIPQGKDYMVFNYQGRRFDVQFN